MDSVIGLAAKTYLLTEFVDKFCAESKGISSTTQNITVETKDIKAISKAIACLDTNLAVGIAALATTSAGLRKNSNEEAIIDLAVQSKALADEFLVSLTATENAASNARKSDEPDAGGFMDEKRLFELRPRLSDIRAALSMNFAAFVSSQQPATLSRCQAEITRGEGEQTGLDQLIDCSLNASFSTSLYICKAYLVVAKRYPGSLSKDDLVEALNHGGLAEQECRDEPEDIDRKISLKNMLDEFDAACRILNGSICLHSETFAGRALMYYVTTFNLHDAMNDEVDHHLSSARVDSAHNLPKVANLSEFADCLPTQAVELLEDHHVATPQFLQQENGAALSLIMDHAGDSLKPAPMFKDWQILVTTLLRLGAKPNLKSTSTDRRSPFEIFAAFYFKAIQRPSIWSQWIDLLPIFFQHGADMNVLFSASGKQASWYFRLFQTYSENTQADGVFNMLFEYGLDPNKVYRTSTIWAYFLENILDNRTWNPQGVREYNSRTSQIYKTAQIFLRRGASLSCVVKGSMEECKAFKQAWEALWPYGQEMQSLLMGSKGEARPSSLEVRYKRKERESGGSSTLPRPVDLHGRL